MIFFFFTGSKWLSSSSHEIINYFKFWEEHSFWPKIVFQFKNSAIDDFIFRQKIQNPPIEKNNKTFFSAALKSNHANLRMGIPIIKLPLRFQVYFSHNKIPQTDINSISQQLLTFRWRGIAFTYFASPRNI